MSVGRFSSLPFFFSLVRFYSLFELSIWQRGRVSTPHAWRTELKSKKRMKQFCRCVNLTKGRRDRKRWVRESVFECHTFNWLSWHTQERFWGYLFDELFGLVRYRMPSNEAKRFFVVHVQHRCQSIARPPIRRNIMWGNRLVSLYATYWNYSMFSLPIFDSCFIQYILTGQTAQSCRCSV